MRQHHLLESKSLRCALTRGLVAILLVAALSSCGGGSSPPSPSTPPVVANLTYSPHSVAQSPGGTTSIGGSFNFTDAGGDLATVTLVASDSHGTVVGSGTGQIQGAAGQKSGTVQASVTIAVDTAGLYTIKVSVSDQGGAKSNELQGNFRVSVAANLAPVITSTQPGLREFKAANGFLYWSEMGPNVIKRVPTAGGAVEALAPKVVNPSAAVFVGTDVIWLDQAANGVACDVARIVNRTNAAGATQQLAQEAYCAILTTLDVATDGVNAYWVASTQAPDTYLIRAMPLGGGPVTTIASSSNPVIALKAYGGAVYWLERTLLTTTRWIRSVPAAGGLVTTIVDGFYAATDTFGADANAVYYAETIAIPGSPATISLMAQPLAGGSPLTLAADVEQPAAFASDGTTLVWTDTVGIGLPNATHVNALALPAGTPTVLATSSRPPVGLMIAGGNAVWSEDRVITQVSAPAIYSVPIAGGRTAVLYQGQDTAFGLTLDSSGKICWTEAGYVSYPSGSGRIARLLSATTSQTLVEGVYSDSPTFIVVGNDLVVADWQRLKRVPIGGGVPETLAFAPAPIAGITSDGTMVYFDAGGSVYAVPIAGGATTVVAPAPPGFGQSGPIKLAPNGNLYWVADSTNIAYAPATGGTPTVVSMGSLPLGPLAVNATGVYFGFKTFPGISKLPLDGGPAVGITITNQNGGSSVMDLLIDGTTLYWIDGQQIATVPVTGGDADALVAFTSQVAFGADISNLAIDSGHIYWSEPTPPNIRAISR